MPQFFDPRRMARTPGFAQDGLYDDLDMAEQDDYQQMLTPPPPQQGGGLSEMLQAAPDAPLPPPRREYDGGPSVDPGPQMRQRITLPDAPLPPKPGLMRKIIGTAASMYLPPVGREILAPGYDRQMREYNNNRQRMMDEGKLNVQAADEEQKRAHAEAEGWRGGAERSRGKKLDAETAYVGKKPVTVNRNERLYDPATKGVLLEAEAGDDFIELTPESAKRLGITGTKIPKSALGSYISATKPSEEPTTVKEYRAMIKGENPDWDDAAVSREVSRRIKEDRDVALGLKKAQTNRANQPRSSAVSERKAEETSSAEETANEIIEGRQDFHGLTASEKKAVRPFLTKKKWTEPHNYSESEKQSLTGLDGLKRLSGELKPFFTKGKSAPGTGMVTGYAPNWTVSEQGKEVRTKLADMASSVILARSGKAVTPHEMTRIEKFIPTETDTDEQIRVKLENLDEALNTARSSIGRYAKGGQAQPTAGGGTTPPPAPSGGNPPVKLGPPPAGTVWMKNPKTGKVGPVKMADVKQAEGFKYERVQ